MGLDRDRRTARPKPLVFFAKPIKADKCALDADFVAPVQALTRESLSPRWLEPLASTSALGDLALN